MSARAKEILQWLPIPLVFFIGLLAGFLGLVFSIITISLIFIFVLSIKEERERMKQLMNLNEGEIRVLYFLRGQKTVSDISATTGYSWQGTKKILTRLKQRGFVLEDRQGMFVLTDEGQKLREIIDLINPL